MKRVNELSDNVSQIDINEIIRGILETPKYEKFVPDLVRTRLNDSGTRADGSLIVTYFAKSPNVYAHRTIFIKKVIGQPYDHVTLKNTGAFHKTFAVDTGRDSFKIDYDEVKGSEKISDNVDLTETITLSSDEITELRGEILDDFNDKLKDALLQ